MALSYLLTLQLLLFQRVNKYSQRCIEASTSLQRQLYFLPGLYKHNSKQIEENPFLLKIDRPFWTTQRLDGFLTAYISIEELVDDGLPKASWKRMFVGTPLVTRILVLRYILGESERSFSSRKLEDLYEIENQNGCKMGEVVDCVSMFRDRADCVRLWIYYNESSIRDIWPMSY